ncbi:MAG: helix-turn-helix domain-containing protein [Pyrinomonadaceae bacterium]
MFLEELGRRLRERRELRKLTQGDIANALQISPQAVSKWERGENAPDIILLCGLARLLGVTTDWLLSGLNDGGQQFEATIFVSSSLGFTTRCAGLKPADIAIWSNGFFHQLTETVLQHGGVPVKYMGDGFLAFFAGGDHCARAILAAINARELSTEQIVIGLATGPAHLATIGHPSYARPDILGAAVNCAFRVNGWAAINAKSRIAAAAETVHDLADQFRVSGMTELTFKGFAEPVRVCEIIGRSAA